MATQVDLINVDNNEIEAQRILQIGSGTAGTLLALDSSKNVTNASSVLLKNAYLVVQNHAAPADGDLAAGDAAIWFDQTNGAGKLMVKAKTANGTVATGSVTLS